VKCVRLRYVARGKVWRILITRDYEWKLEDNVKMYLPSQPRELPCRTLALSTELIKPFTKNVTVFIVPMEGGHAFRNGGSKLYCLSVCLSVPSVKMHRLKW